MSKFARHFFVCQKQRTTPGSEQDTVCDPRAAALVYRTLVDELGAHPALWGDVQVSASGCLGPCTRGPVVVVYPEGTWYAGLDGAGAVEVAREHLAHGRVVEHLCYEFEDDDP